MFKGKMRSRNISKSERRVRYHPRPKPCNIRFPTSNRIRSCRRNRLSRRTPILKEKYNPPINPHRGFSEPECLPKRRLLYPERTDRKGREDSDLFWETYFRLLLIDIARTSLVLMFIFGFVYYTANM